MFLRRASGRVVLRALACALFAACLVAPSTDSAAQAFGQDATPLEEIARKMTVTEGAGLRLVSIRCTSFYITASAMEKEDRPELATKYEETAEQFMVKAVALSREDKEILIKSLTRISRMYYGIAQSARDSKGDMFEDPLMRSDLGFCMRLASQA